MKLAVAGSASACRRSGCVAPARRGYPGMRFDSAPVIVAATAFLIAVALVASYLPARTASRISAVEALRLE